MFALRKTLRALIARALAQDTPLLMADEPIAGLDPAHLDGELLPRRAERALGEGDELRGGPSAQRQDSGIQPYRTVVQVDKVLRDSIVASVRGVLNYELCAYAVPDV